MYVIYANMLIYLIEQKKNRGKYGKNLDANACCVNKSKVHEMHFREVSF